MILTPAAAKQTIELGDNDEDVVNEVREPLFNVVPAQFKTLS